jgi:hypothetical protein
MDGNLSIQGNIKAMRSLAEPLQVAMDNGARKALIPLENKTELSRSLRRHRGAGRPRVLLRSDDGGDEGVGYDVKPTVDPVVKVWLDTVLVPAMVRRYCQEARAYLTDNGLAPLNEPSVGGKIAKDGELP